MLRRHLSAPTHKDHPASAVAKFFNSVNYTVSVLSKKLVSPLAEALIEAFYVVLPCTTVWVDLENIMLSEISQSEKDKYHMISLIGDVIAN